MQHDELEIPQDESWIVFETLAFLLLLSVKSLLSGLC